MGNGSTPYEDAFLAVGYNESEEGIPKPEDLTSDQLLAVYIELAKARDAAKAHEKRVSAAFSNLEPLVVRLFQDEGKQKDTRRGRTVYLAEETWPKVLKDDLLRELPNDASKEALKAVDERARQRLTERLAGDPSTEHLAKLTYNGQTLRSFVIHDCPEDPETFEKEIPAHLEDVLGVSTVFRAKVLKS